MLRPGLSFCIVGGQAVFLDLPNDRYFCLGPAIEADFLALLEEAPGARDANRWQRLAAAGLLTGRTTDPLPQPCAIGITADVSLIDTTIAPPGAAATLRAAAKLGAARLRLRIAGLAAEIERLRRVRIKGFRRDAELDALTSLAAPFFAAGRFLSSQDMCLSHSLAIAHALAGAGHAAALVIGVRLGPFAAHSWVQCGDCVVNDRVDMVRTFSPVLVA